MQTAKKTAVCVLYSQYLAAADEPISGTDAQTCKQAENTRKIKKQVNIVK